VKPNWRDDNRKRRRVEAAPPAAPAAAAAASAAVPAAAAAEASSAAAAPAAPPPAPRSHMLTPCRMGDVAKRLLLQAGVDSIIIVSEGQPAAVALAEVRFAAPSASLAVFCRELQPAAEALRVLRALGLCVNLSLSEIFWRPHQVLPARTHPAMVFHGASGYVLRATVAAHPFSVVTTPAEPAPEAAAAPAAAAIATG
jgi:hypothetical protein